MKENFDAFKNKAKNIVNATVIAGMSVLPQKSTGESIMVHDNKAPIGANTEVVSERVSEKLSVLLDKPNWREKLNSRKTREPVVYTNANEYQKAKKLYEDSLFLFNKSFEKIESLEKQLLREPKIFNWYDGTTAMRLYKKTHEGVLKNLGGRLGTDEEQEYFEKNPDLKTGKDYDNFLQARKLFLDFKGNGYINEFKKDTLRSYQMESKDFYNGNDTLTTKIWRQLPYEFNNIYNFDVEPSKTAFFEIGENHFIVSKEPIAHDSTIIEKKRTRTKENLTKDDYEVPDSVKINYMKKEFGDYAYDNKPYYEYGPAEQPNMYLWVPVYEKPVQPIKLPGKINIQGRWIECKDWAMEKNIMDLLNAHGIVATPVGDSPDYTVSRFKEKTAGWDGQKLYLNDGKENKTILIDLSKY